MSLRPNDQSSHTSFRAGEDAPTAPALHGAFIAYKKTSSTAQSLPPPVVSTSRNGALAAAARAGVDSSKLLDERRSLSTLSPNRREPPDSLKAGRNAFARRPSTLFGQEKPGFVTQSNRRQSPSHIAATRATERATSVPKPLNRESTGKIPTSRAKHHDTKSHVHKDENSIPATSSLVELFEAKERSSSPTSKSSGIATNRIVSPIPIRPHMSVLATQSNREVSTHHSDRYSKPQNLINIADFSPGNGNAAAPTSAKSQTSPRGLHQKWSESNHSVHISRGLSVPLLPDQGENHRDLSTQSLGETARQPASTSIQKYNHAPRNQIMSTVPNLNVITNSNSYSDSDSEELFRLTKSTAPRNADPSFYVSKFRGGDTRRSASSRAPTPPPKPLSFQASGIIGTSKELDPSLPSHRPSSTVSISRLITRDLKPQLTADSLANAMVASSLASSRAPSPTKLVPTPPPPRRSYKSRSFSLLTTSSPASRAPSPLKSFRQTLRSAPGVYSDEDFRAQYNHDHSHNIFKRKHPNKHAEGDRKRWRDTVTEAERKKYEGIWASNRGAAVKMEDTHPDEVHGLVVKDIWSRSGLPDTVLEAIWDLVVDFGKKGGERRVLRKEEFVVGTWLIDQCLKGRKLPSEVGSSVWASVRKLMDGIVAK